MEDWTVGQILATLTAIAGGLTALGVIMKKAGGAITKWLQLQLAPINTKLVELSDQTTENDKNRAMDFIVRFLADVEQGATMIAHRYQPILHQGKVQGNLAPIALPLDDPSTYIALIIIEI